MNLSSRNVGIGFRDSQRNLAMRSIENNLEMSELRQLSRLFVAMPLGIAMHGRLKIKDPIA